MSDADWKRYKERSFNNLDKHIGLFSPDMLQRLLDHVDFMTHSDITQIDDFVERSDTLADAQYEVLNDAIKERHEELQRLANRTSNRLAARRSVCKYDHHPIYAHTNY